MMFIRLGGRGGVGSMIDLIWSLRRAGLCVLMKGGWHLDLAIG